MLTFFPTDILLLLTVLAMTVLLFLSLRQEHLRRPWRKVMGSSTGLVSALLLGLFTCVAVLDSVRIEQGVHTLSLLDLGLSGLRNATEKTYSEPLSLYASAHEMVRESDGREVWKVPRLVFAGQHLAHPEEDHRTDLIYRLIKGLILGGVGAFSWRF